MSIAFRGIVAPMLMVMVPGTGPRIIDNHVSAKIAVDIGRQYAGLHPGATGLIMVITSDIVIINAYRGVIPIVITINIRIRIVGTPHHTPPQTKNRGQEGSGQHLVIKILIFHFVCYSINIRGLRRRILAH